MASQAFKFNTSAEYKSGRQVLHAQALASLTEAQVQVTQAEAFETQYVDVFEKYRHPQVISDAVFQAWGSHPMQFWQNQLNFAVWCATTGCGVSAEDHLANADPQFASLYRFHTYYQIRRVLKELQTPLPQDHGWNATDGQYDRRAYEKICNEFNISPHSDWRISGANHGLGKAYNYWTNNGYHPIADGTYYPTRMSLAKPTSNTSIHVDFIKQDNPSIDTAWREFIVAKSEGFTRAGVERLNDSIRTYVWAILGAQAQTRTTILGTGTAFDAQKQYLADVEDAISAPVDLPSSIKRYQDMLQHAASEVNFMFGGGLYMAPSDMQLRVATVVGYNNLIIIATESQTLGLNIGLNILDAPPDLTNDTGEKGLIQPTPSPRVIPGAIASLPALLPLEGLPEDENHEETKTAVVLSGITLGLLALWFLR